ncbi:protein kinase [Spirillospora sp. NBC_00431]
MGEVWAADDMQLRRRVALKIVLAGHGASGMLTDRLGREAENAAKLQHPGITVVHDIGEHEGQPFFVMELLDGTDFAALLVQNPQGLPIDRALETGAAVADALGYAHRRGVAHGSGRLRVHPLRVTRGRSAVHRGHIARVDASASDRQSGAAFSSEGRDSRRAGLDRARAAGQESRRTALAR